ncbi:unnamed protein product [Caenorhabditis auriculariae]|uniref:Uncharacterized protein n=1 Tax=Caenorhabditis auriculariae TaxID=2777116 RepID=A0A8S1H9X9_9PELO|nr:unnamed protein product [Caenorhabditis auriculariae]
MTSRSAPILAHNRVASVATNNKGGHNPTIGIGTGGSLSLLSDLRLMSSTVKTPPISEKKKERSITKVRKTVHSF